ncbi:hypothetical protein ASD64_04855 [Mesorhizobium sp. Root157]|uniref:DUF2163 domain-containing protein n=1 Tax=Mesorhizobium sp. Root157 TaxID=1736477 RepID=UPI0006F1E02B|nr:DUF2163 domain-containing protein [Mesorhizobium sp. Root157]KQZ94202.1 hypothetical protein ASD64_04855 [Mesorhizobium sp. Root157]
MSGYPQALIDHFGRDVTTVCHCWRLTRKDGTTAGFTDHDRVLVVDGSSFEPETGLSASEARQSLGLSVDTVDVEGALSSGRITDEDIAAGLYDEAKVETYLVNWRNPQDFAVIRVATIGKITRRDGSFVAELESSMHRLDQPNGRYVTRKCDAELGDTRCGVSLDQPAFNGAGIVEGMDGPDTVRVSGLAGFQVAWFSFGVLTWTSGANIGRTERIVDHRQDGGSTLLILQPAVGPATQPGDTFTVVAGCDHSFATCKAKFANALNFRGFPHLPGNDAAYSYVSDGGNFDGGPVVP